MDIQKISIFGEKTENMCDKNLINGENGDNVDI